MAPKEKDVLAFPGVFILVRSVNSSCQSFRICWFSPKTAPGPCCSREPAHNNSAAGTQDLTNFTIPVLCTFVSHNRFESFNTCLLTVSLPIMR